MGTLSGYPFLPLPIRGELLKKRICSSRIKVFSFKSTPFFERPTLSGKAKGKSPFVKMRENHRGVHIQLKVMVSLSKEAILPFSFLLPLFKGDHLI